MLRFGLFMAEDGAGDWAEDGAEEVWTGFDTIVLAVGIQARNELVEGVKEKVSEVYVIGDAAEPRKGVDAMREGAEVGRKI